MFLGEFLRGSDVYLELNLKDKRNNNVIPDENPQAIIYSTDKDSQDIIAEITLDKKADNCYYSFFEIPMQFRVTDYIVNYTAKINNKVFETKERFKIKQNQEIEAKIDKNIKDIILQIGKKEKKETIYDLLEQIVNQTKTKEEEEKVTISDLNFLTKEGYRTTVLYNGTPLKDATIKAYDNNQNILLNSTKSDENGRWKMEITKGECRVEFIHPNGRLLKKIVKVV